MKDPRARRLYGGLLVALYIAAVLLPVVVAGIAREETAHSFLYTFATYLALSGFAIIALQFLLSARFRWLEAPFGQDLLYDFHKRMAVVGFCFILAHPLLMSIGDGVWEILYALDVSWVIWLGRIALLLLIFQVLNSLYRQRIGMEYEVWKKAHNTIALAVLVLAFVHSLGRGGDFDLVFLSWYWPGLLALATGTWVTSSIIRPMRLRRRPWSVASVEQVSHDTWNVVFGPPAGEAPYEHEPGQFHFVTLRRARGLPRERHHWTISSSPEEPRIRASTIKALGDFTSTIDGTQPGDEAEIYGPYGRFSHTRYPDEDDLVFAVGGIGITPIISMLRYMRDTGDARRVLLIHTNPEERDFVFREELDEIALGEAPRLEIVEMLEDPPEGWDGETGILDPEAMERLLAPHLEDRAFYVCGPPPMMEMVKDWLSDQGVPARRIHSERFDI